jgi:hypothetical protein
VSDLGRKNQPFDGGHPRDERSHLDCCSSVVVPGLSRWRRLI